TGLSPCPWIRPRQPETAKTLRCETGRYQAPCRNSLVNLASASKSWKAYSAEALVKKPRCGSIESSRLSQKNVPVTLEIWMSSSDRSRPGTGVPDSISEQTSFSGSLRLSITHFEILYS